MTELQVDFDRSNIDAGIRYGAGDYPDLIVKHLMDDYIFPVINCSHQQSLTLNDLTEHVLIRDNSANYFNWEGWLELVGDRTCNQNVI